MMTKQWFKAVVSQWCVPVAFPWSPIPCTQFRFYAGCCWPNAITVVPRRQGGRFCCLGAKINLTSSCSTYGCCPSLLQEFFVGWPLVTWFGRRLNHWSNALNFHSPDIRWVVFFYWMACSCVTECLLNQTWEQLHYPFIGRSKMISQSGCVWGYHR